MSFLRNYYVNSTPKINIHLITHDVKRAIRESEIHDGLVTILIPGGTAGLTILENDPKLHEEFRDLIVQAIPESSGARPSRRSGSGKNSAHLRAAWVGVQLSIPVQDGKLMMGPWQEVVLLDFDDKALRREIAIQVMGGSAAAQG